MVYAAILAVAIAIAVVALKALGNKGKSASNKPLRPLTIGEMNETQLAQHLDQLQDDVMSMDGLVTKAAHRERTLRQARDEAWQEIRYTHEAQPGNTEALQVAIDSFEAAEADYERHLRTINGDEEKQQLGIKQRAKSAHAAFNTAKREIEGRMAEFDAARASVLSNKIEATNGLITAQTNALEITADTTSEKVRAIRAAADLEAQMRNGDAEDEEAFRKEARNRAILAQLGIKS